VSEKMSLEDLKTALADYEDILTFEDRGETVEILTKGFIPKNKWASVNAIVKELGGKYFPANQSSDGKGRWKVPQQQASSETPIEHRWANALEVAVGEIERIIADLRKVKT